MLEFRKGDAIIQPKIHKNTLVFLPGWSRSAKADLNVFKNVPFLENTRIRIVQPPHRQSTRGFPMLLPSWFQLLIEAPTSMLPGLNEISYLIEEILQDEYEICHNLFLGGFSQGGVTSLYTGFVTSKVPLLGIFALSCFIPITEWNKERLNIPLFMYHGKKDEIVNQKTTEAMVKSTLNQFNLIYITDSKLGHTYSWLEFNELKKWMKACLNREKI